MYIFTLLIVSVAATLVGVNACDGDGCVDEEIIIIDIIVPETFVFVDNGMDVEVFRSFFGLSDNDILEFELCYIYRYVAGLKCFADKTLDHVEQDIAVSFTGKPQDRVTGMYYKVTPGAGEKILEIMTCTYGGYKTNLVDITLFSNEAIIQGVTAFDIVEDACSYGLIPIASECYLNQIFCIQQALGLCVEDMFVTSCWPIYIDDLDSPIDQCSV